MNQVPKLIFNDEGEAVADVRSCRRATELREFFWENGVTMKTQTNQGQLILQVPEASATLPNTVQMMEVLYEKFCQQAGLEIIL